MATGPLVTKCFFITLPIVQTPLATPVGCTAELTRLARGNLAAAVNTQFVGRAGALFKTKAPYADPCCLRINAEMTAADHGLASARRTTHLAHGATAGQTHILRLAPARA